MERGELSIKMSNEQAKDYFEDDYKIYERVMGRLEFHKEHSGYPSEEQALTIAINAIDKQIPKTATFVKEIMGNMVFQCNTCGRRFFAKTNLAHYCVNCGQRLREE